MKYKINNTFKMMLLVSIVLTSCNDWIETGFPQNQIATEQVFEDVQSANAALAGLYGSLWNSSLISGGYDGTGALLSTYTDDLDCYYTSTTNGALDIYNNQLLETNSMVERVWNIAYQQIYIANSIIHGIDQSAAISETEKNRIKGEALFIRSLLYFNLVQIYGDIPYTDSVDYEYNSTLSKSNTDEVISRLEIDLDQAINWLPEEYRSAERIYVNKSTAVMLKAKLMLLSESWNEAENLGKSLLQNTNYSLTNDLNEVFNKNNPGIFWQLKPKNSGDATKEYTLYYFNNSVPNSYALTDDFISSFSTQDLRFQNWIVPVMSGSNTFYRPRKYKNGTGNSTEYSPIFRIEELYFIVAESLIMQNKLTEASTYINATRTRAGLPVLPSNLSTNQILEELENEKRREFFTEMGHRFFDLKRWNKLNDLQVIKPNWESKHRLWPLPQKELLLNNNLKPQNNGY